MPAPTPVFFEKAFAQDASGSFRNAIPTAPVGTQRASLSLGFPPLVMTPVAAGGKPMLGPDANGILYMLSTHAVYQQSGQPYQYSGAVVAAIGGYAIGTLLGSTDGLTLWYNILAANTNDPDVAAVGWVPLFHYGYSTITGLIGGVRVLTRIEALGSVIILQGVLAANLQVVLPNDLRDWLIVNSTTGAFAVTVKTVAGTGVVIPAGGLAAPLEVYGDGTNLYPRVSPLNLPIDVNPTPNTLIQRTSLGYGLATYFNQNSGLEVPTVGAVFVQNSAADGFFRKISIVNFEAQLLIQNMNGVLVNAQVPVGVVTQHTAAILANAALTGVPTTPTPATADSTTKIASTAFVHAAILAQGFKVAAGRISSAGVLQPGSVGVSGAFRSSLGHYTIDVTAAGFTQLPAPTANYYPNPLNSDVINIGSLSNITLDVVTSLPGVVFVDKDFSFIAIGT